MGSGGAAHCGGNIREEYVGKPHAKDLCAEDKNMQERNERRQDEWKDSLCSWIGKINIV